MLWDLGGQESLRIVCLFRPCVCVTGGPQIWPKYFGEAQGIIFVIDSSDHERFDEAKAELEQTIREACSGRRIPVLVLANKQDVPSASESSVLESLLQLESLQSSCAALSINPTVALTGAGVPQGVEWLVNAMIHTSPVPI